MNNDARLYFTAAAFFGGIILASHSVSLLNDENASFLGLASVFIQLIGGYFLIPLFVWLACTEMISKESSKKYKEVKLDPKTDEHSTFNPDK